jgi:hypothetical protein
MGHRPGVKGGYFPVPPVDSPATTSAPPCAGAGSRASRSKCITTKSRPPASAKSAPSSTRWCKRADWTQILKYIVHNVAHSYGKTATFMPKPIVGDNGSGMHVHQSIWKDGKNLFAGNGYAGLSEFALYYIGGIIKHAKALNAITNPGTNSYKRLVPASKPGQAGLLGPQPFGVDPHPARAVGQGAPHRTRFPDPTGQPLPVLRRADDGRPGRRAEQDPPRRPRRQEPVRPAAGRGQADPDRLRQPGRGAGLPGQGSRVPDQAAACSATTSSTPTSN